MNLYSITSMIFIRSLHVTLLLWCTAGNLQHRRSGELIDSLQLITTTLLTAVSLPWNAGLYAPFPHCHTSGSTLHSRTSGQQCGPPPPNAARRGGSSHTQTVGTLLEHEAPVHMHVRTYVLRGCIQPIEPLPLPRTQHTRPIHTYPCKTS